MEEELPPTEASTLLIAKVIARFPILCFFIVLCIPVTFGVVAFYHPVTIDYSLDSFQAVGNPMLARWFALVGAEREWGDTLSAISSFLSSNPSTATTRAVGPSTGTSATETLPGSTCNDCLSPDPIGNITLAEKRRGAHWAIWMTFRHTDGGNILEDEHIRYIHEVVMKIRNISRFTDYCATDANGKCRMPDGPFGFFFPSFDSRTGVGTLDGHGMRQIPSILGTRAIVESNILFYTDSLLSETNLKSSFLRVGFRFGCPWNTNCTAHKQGFEQWLLDGAWEALKGHDRKPIEVFFGGNAVTDLEILEVVKSDVALATVSLIIVFLMMWLCTTSLFVTLSGVLQIVASLPLVYFIIVKVLGISHLGIFNAISIFVIIGIGVDDVFIIYNAFEQNKHIQDMASRLSHTYRVSAKTSFLTSFTTASAFGANILSSIPAIRFLATIMTLLVAANWCLTMVWMPPLLVIWAERIVPCCCWLRNKLRSPASLELLSNEDVDYDDNAAELLEKPELLDNYSRESLKTFLKQRHRETIFRDYLATFICKWWRSIIVAYFMVFAISIGLSTQLRRTTQSPAFFARTSNLHKYMDFFMSGFTVEPTADIRHVEYGCDLQLNSGAVIDACGICGGPCSTTQCCFLPAHSTREAPTSRQTACPDGRLPNQCGLCSSELPCLGCDGVPFSGAVFDKCDVCNGTNTCKDGHNGFEEITIVWGITGVNRSKVNMNDFIAAEMDGLAIYNGSIDFSTPEAQQSLLDACIEITESELVYKGITKCFIRPFKVWALQKGYGFPVRDQPLRRIAEFLLANRGYALDVGFAANITHPQMLWTKMKATATLVKNVPSFAAWKSVSQWEQLMTKMTSSWGKALGPVWQTCFNYRRIVTEVMAVNGVAAGVAISISVAIVAITIFTRNLVTVALVMVCLSTMIGILLGLFWIFRFEIGAVEALSVSILVGLCTDYVLHIAEAWSDSSSSCSSRTECMTKALTKMGFSIFSGALTTFAASFILVFCRNQMFVKVGIIISTSVVVSMVVTLTLFPALLVWIGPLQGTGDVVVLARKALQRACNLIRRR